MNTKSVLFKMLWSLFTSWYGGSSFWMSPTAGQTMRRSPARPSVVSERNGPGPRVLFAVFGVGDVENARGRFVLLIVEQQRSGRGCVGNLLPVNRDAGVRHHRAFLRHLRRRLFSRFFRRLWPLLRRRKHRHRNEDQKNCHACSQRSLHEPSQRIRKNLSAFLRVPTHRRAFPAEETHVIHPLASRAEAN